MYLLCLSLFIFKIWTSLLGLVCFQKWRWWLESLQKWHSVRGESPTSIWCEPFIKVHSLPRESSFTQSSNLKLDPNGIFHLETRFSRVKLKFVRSTWGGQDPDLVNQLSNANLGLDEAMVDPNVVTWLQFYTWSISKGVTIMIWVIMCYIWKCQ